MNPGLWFPVVLALLAGGMVALQAPTNVLLSRAGGSPLLAALISFAVGTAALLVAWLVAGPRPAVAPFAALPWYAWLGGLYGAVFVAIAAFAAPRLGLATLITLGIAGQIVVALALDHAGAFGLPRTAISPMRLAGALLVVAGVVLVRRG